MKYEITEEQIKELAKGNAKVKTMFPEVFETKLEAGKWHYDKGNDWLFFRKDNTSAYGFVGSHYGNNYSMLSNIGFRLATKEEAEKLLDGKII